jgi:hypothetical protein
MGGTSPMSLRPAFINPVNEVAARITAGGVAGRAVPGALRPATTTSRP